MFKPREYQVEAIEHALKFFKRGWGNAIEILPTGSGKSVVIANIGKEQKEQTLVLQPSKEILEQNYQKFTSYGFRAGIYSASLNQKHIEKLTFATIGSIIRRPHVFKNVSKIIVDECHLVNSEAGMYNEFIKYTGAQVLGLTATPYRLVSEFGGAQLKFITRTEPRIFSDVLYYIQNSTLFNAGHLAELEYFNFDVIDRTMLDMNSSGTDFTESSLKAYYRQIDMPKKTADFINSLLRKRKNLLGFHSLISEAREVARYVPGAVVLTGDTEPGERRTILSNFKRGKIRCVLNVGVLTTGFDYPELECVLLARSTMSLALYYQILGRGMRPHPNKKSCWIVDLGGNVKFFGKVETMEIKKNGRGAFSVWNNGRQLTDVPFTKN